MVDDPGTRREFQVGIDRMARKPNTQEGKANEQDGDEEGEEPLRTDCYASHACADIVQAVRRGSTDNGPVSSDAGKVMQERKETQPRSGHEAIAGQDWANFCFRRPRRISRMGGGFTRTLAGASWRRDGHRGRVSADGRE